MKVKIKENTRYGWEKLTEKKVIAVQNVVKKSCTTTALRLLVGQNKNFVITAEQCLVGMILSYQILRDWIHEHFFGEAFEAKDCEVVGNIFDNPELMEK